MLLKLAKEKGQTLSKLIREGAGEVIKKNYGKTTPQQKAMKFFAHVPKEYKVDATGEELIDLIQTDRNG